MIPDYPEFVVNRDVGNFSLQNISTKYDNHDGRELVILREEFSDQMVTEMRGKGRISQVKE